MTSESPKEILHELERIKQFGSVLFIAAHPDDENTELLSYLARGRNYRVAYLSVTRGDGGQNVLGADLGDKLGVARTQELLAARQIDGAQQFFSRAVDFGFSKNYEETLNAWNKQELLSDMVRVIRQFRPDVLITRFSPSPGGTHGHHTTSALLAKEAFKLAGDPHAFPEQKLAAWQPKRILWNVSTYQKEKVNNANSTLKIETTGKDSVSGQTFFEMASASRAMHKTQGFDTYKLAGSPEDRRYESFQLLDGEPAGNDIMDGVDTSWSRVPGGAEIDQELAEIIKKFDLANPAASVPDLLKLRVKLKSLSVRDSVAKEKTIQLDRILKYCLGLKTETTIVNSDVVPGEPMKMHLSATLSSKLPDKLVIRWKAVRFPLLKKEINREVNLQANEASVFDVTETLPASTPLTQPYWLRVQGKPGMFHVDEAELIGSAENAPPFPVEDIFEIDGQTLVVQGEPVQLSSDSLGNQIHSRLNVIPPVSLRFISDVVIMEPGTSRSVELEVKSARANSSGKISLEAPHEDSSHAWKIEPRTHSFNFASVGQAAKFTFTVTAPSKSETATLRASAEINGARYHSQRQEINYPHIPRQLLQAPAMLKVVSLQLKTRGHAVGYLPGAGDSLVENLQQMGYAVKTLDDANLTAKDLEGLDAVVIGVRAFNVREKIGSALPTLFQYIEKGGTVIAQYNRPDKLKAEKIAPFDLHISGDRVTDEKAAITFLAPDSPVLNSPNKITKSDFDGWVQERGLYFANRWDPHFTPILSCNDAGEPPSQGALLIAPYGKGHYVYTGLGFFRQLPAGVPGAYRLFANLVSLGK